MATLNTIAAPKTIQAGIAEAIAQAVAEVKRWHAFGLPIDDARASVKARSTLGAGSWAKVIEQTTPKDVPLPERFIRLAVRPLTDDERDLMKHVSMWGSSGYPIRKLQRKWFWEFRSAKAPVVFATKREAVANFEAFHALLIELSAYESWRKAVGLK